MSPSGQGLGRARAAAPRAVESGVGTRPAGSGAGRGGQSGPRRPPCPAGQEGAAVKEPEPASGARASGPVSRPLRSKHEFGPGGPGALEATLGPRCCAWRLGQANPNTPSAPPRPHSVLLHPLLSPLLHALDREPSCVAVGDLRGGPRDAALAGSSTACATWSPRAKGARDPAGAAGPEPEAKALVGAGGALLLGRGMQSAAVVVPVSMGLQDPGRGLSPELPGIPDAPAQQEIAAGVEDLEDRGVERLRTRPFLPTSPGGPERQLGHEKERPWLPLKPAPRHQGARDRPQDAASGSVLPGGERCRHAPLPRLQCPPLMANDVPGPGTRWFPQMRSPAFQGGTVGKDLFVCGGGAGGGPVLSLLLDRCGNLLPCPLRLPFRLVRSPLPLVPNGLRSQVRTAFGGQPSPPSSAVRS